MATMNMSNFTNETTVAIRESLAPYNHGLYNTVTEMWFDPVTMVLNYSDYQRDYIQE